MFMYLKRWKHGQRLGSTYLLGQRVTLTVSSNLTTLLVEYHREHHPVMLMAILRVDDRGQIRWNWSVQSDVQALVRRYPGLEPQVRERIEFLWAHVAHYEPIPPGVAVTIGADPVPAPAAVESDTLLLPVVVAV